MASVLVLLVAGVVACGDSDGDGDGTGAGDGDGDGRGCGEGSPIVALDHETTDPDRGIGGGVPEISVVTEGGEAEMITGDWVASQPDFSPDGDRLVVVKAEGDYESAGPSTTALWVIGTDGIEATEPRELTGGELLDEDPDWSPDGRTIAFARRAFDPANGRYDHHIMTVPAEGGEPRALVSVAETGEQLDEPAWSPDGTRLAYIHGVYDEATNRTTTTVWTVGADGRGAAPLGAVTDVHDVAWHPDGSSLLAGGWDGVAVADPVAGTVEPVAGPVRHAVWAPDGEHLYHARSALDDAAPPGIQRSRVEGGELVDTEDVVSDRHPSFGFAVGPCG